MSEPSAFPRPIEELIQQFSKLPGIGRRSAERVAFHLLKSSPDDALQLAAAISAVKKNVKPCSICCNQSHVDPCSICEDTRRDPSTVLVVEQTRDLINLEATGSYRGVYHVLGGRLDPLAGVGPEELSIDLLLKRIDDPAKNSRGGKVEEVIFGLNPDMEGDTTSLYLSEQLSTRDVKVSRLARGLPSGSQLEYASRSVLADAIQGRQSL